MRGLDGAQAADHFVGWISIPSAFMLIAALNLTRADMNCYLSMKSDRRSALRGDGLCVYLFDIDCDRQQRFV